MLILRGTFLLDMALLELLLVILRTILRSYRPRHGCIEGHKLLTQNDWPDYLQLRKDLSVVSHFELHLFRRGKV